MNFEESLKRLEEVARKLEAGNISLDESVKLFEEGSKLKKHCETLLKEAQLKVEKIIENPDGSISVKEE
ncbi:MAG: exodeoxyribonuclease VII small subunit [Alphaproteobacteria bacterium]|nr:MAG: exodeoxyribonuclease VII small subunit [Alphaproteobacteria bacterium]